MRMLITATLILAFLAAKAQDLPNDTVKVKALLPLRPSGDGPVLVVRAHAVYRRVIVPGSWAVTRDGEGGPEMKRILICLLSTNKKDTLRNVFDYKHINW